MKSICSLLKSAGGRAGIDGPEAHGLAVAEPEHIAVGLDETGLARFVFIERAEIEQGVLAEGFGPGLEGPPAGLIGAEPLAGLELAIGSEGRLGEEETIEAAVVVVRAVEFEGDGVRARPGG